MIEANKKHWVREAQRICLWLSVAGVLGYLNNFLFESLFAVTITYIIWVLSQLQGIEAWLQNDRVKNPHNTFGFWGSTCHRIFQLQLKQDRLRLAVEDELNRFHDSFASLTDAVVMLDEHEQLLWCNQAANMHLGLQLDKHKGQKLDWHWSNDAFWQYYRVGDYTEAFEMSAPLEADRRLSVQISHFGLNNYVLFARDITEIHKLEEMRRDFVSNVSHELRTPLTVLIGYVENLSMLNEQIPVLEKPLLQMAQSTERMELLIKDLLQLSKLETSPHTMHHSVVYLRQLCKDIVGSATANPLSDEKIIHLDIKHDIVMKGNETQLYSAFMNLVTNALKYSDAGANITLSCWIDEKGINVKVSDDGIGIDEKHIQRLTERFYRVDESRSNIRPGTGLGLAIVKHVLALHDGELLVHSKLMEGSEFTCVFPRFRIASLDQIDHASI